MCGILGLFHLGGGALCDPAAVPRALAALRHRGPDDSAFWRGPGVVLGATRLALMDPAHGRQPVRDEAGRFHLVMNGELFPEPEMGRDLERRGHRLRSRSDTEFAVHLFEEAWAGALEGIDGQYALAVHDRAERRLLLARDRMGICPLHYAIVGEVLAFASEPKALFGLGFLEPRLDPHGLDSVLAFGCVPAPQTAWLGVKALAPGTFLEARDGAVRVARYWDHPYPDAGMHRVRTAPEAAEELEHLLGGAVRRRLRADAPVGIFLSGGMDSAVVAALAAREPGARPPGFTVGFREAEYDERTKARDLARRLDLPLEEVVTSEAALADDFPEYVFRLDVPTMAGLGIPNLALAKRAARDVKAVLTGAGADELFGGYDFFAADHWRRRLEGSVLAPLAVPVARAFTKLLYGRTSEVFPTPRDRAWSARVFGFHPAFMVWMSRWKAMRDAFYSPDLRARPGALDFAPELDLPREAMGRWDPLDRSLYVTSRFWLSEFSVGSLKDRTAMAHSLEARHPFMDRRVVEFAAGVAPALKWEPAREKLLLRQAAARILPAGYAVHRKQGFRVPSGTPFVGADAPAWARELLSRERLEGAGWFDPAAVAGAAARLGAFKERRRAGLAATGRAPLAYPGEGVDREWDGTALTCVLAMQLLDDFVRRGRYSPAGLVPPGSGPEPAEVD